MKTLKIAVSCKDPVTGIRLFIKEGSKPTFVGDLFTTTSLSEAKRYLGIEAAEAEATKAQMLRGGYWKAQLHAYEE